MSDKNNGRKQPEEKYVEKFDDNFENFFSEEETEAAPKGRRRKKTARPKFRRRQARIFLQRPLPMRTPALL